MKVDKPKVADNILHECLGYLDMKSEELNDPKLYGFAQYLQGEFGIGKKEAKDILQYWIHTNKERNT